jgi:glycosyltransferase involved in cell wall biosynthesis
LIDTYNHERFIEQAIVSVLEQDLSADQVEILVVDDGSTDRTPEIVRKFEPRLRLIRKANGGQASAFNVGVSQAQAPIVAFLDGDDWWAPQKLRRVLQTFEENPGLGAMGHGYYEVNMSTARRQLVVPERTCRLAMRDVAGAHSFHAVCGLLATSKLAVAKEVLDRIIPIPEELVFAADAYVFILAVAIAGAIVLDQPLCFYRLHAGNLDEAGRPARETQRREFEEFYVQKTLAQLPSLGVPPDVVAALAEPWRLESERYRLAIKGGKPWSAFRNELATYRLTYRDASFGYKAYKSLALGLALLMPPASFYRLKRWYARKGLKRLREKLGSPVPAEPIRVLRHFC